MGKNGKWEVRFDNGGGIILFLSDDNGNRVWVHYYSPAHGEDAGADLAEYLYGDDDLATWEGNEIADLGDIEYDYEDVRNGGYYWLDWRDGVKPRPEDEYWGYNHEDFVRGFRRAKKALTLK